MLRKPTFFKIENQSISFNLSVSMFNFDVSKFFNFSPRSLLNLNLLKIKIISIHNSMVYGPSLFRPNILRAYFMISTFNNYSTRARWI